MSTGPATKRSSTSLSVKAMSGFRRFIKRARSWPGTGKAFLRGAIGTIKDAEAHFQSVQEKSEQIRQHLESTGQKLVFGNVGLAISAWAKMEEMLVVIVAMLLRVPAEKAGLMMYSILNFNSWIEIINVLFEIDRQLIPLRSKWTKIAERIRRIKDQRDQLAHHPIEGTLVAIKAPSLDVRTKPKNSGRWMQSKS